MASRSSKPRYYYEPWTVTRSKGWEGAFQFGPPITGHHSESDNAQAALDWEAAKAKAEQNAEAILWGSHMANPSVCVGLEGTVSIMDDRRILGVMPSLTWPDKSITHADMAGRIAACVNACAGIAEPERFIKDVRALVLSYCKGECEDPRDDSRVLTLLARCIPPEELENFEELTTDRSGDRQEVRMQD